MPADRLFHARLGHSAKVSGLTDLEYRVWTTYVLAADDFGVMRADVVAFQAAHDALAARPAAALARAVERLAEAGLVASFRHQGARYLYQRDWQDFQRVRFPARTMHPLPAEAAVSTRTRHLWSIHPGGRKLPALPKQSGSAPEEVAEHSGSSSGLLPERSGSTAEPLGERSRTTPEVLPSRARSHGTANGQRLTADREEGGAGGEGPLPRRPRTWLKSTGPVAAYDAVVERGKR